MRNEMIYQKYFDKIIMVGRLFVLYQIFLPDRHGFSNDALVKILSRGLASRKPNVVTVSALVLVALVMLYNIANLKSVHWYR